MANYNLTLSTLSQLIREASLSHAGLDFDWMAQYILDRLEVSNGAHTNLADITAQVIADQKHSDHSGHSDLSAFPYCHVCNPESFFRNPYGNVEGFKSADDDPDLEPFPCCRDYDTDGQEESDRFVDSGNPDPYLVNAGQSFYGELPADK